MMAWQYLSLKRLQLIAPGCLSLGEQHLMLAEGLKSRSNTLFLLPFGFCPCAGQGLKGGCSPRFRADSQSMLVSHGLACQKHVFGSDANSCRCVGGGTASLLDAGRRLESRCQVRGQELPNERRRLRGVDLGTAAKAERSGAARHWQSPEGSAPGMLEAEVSVHDHLEQPLFERSSEKAHRSWRFVSSKRIPRAPALVGISEWRSPLQHFEDQHTEGPPLQKTEKRKHLWLSGPRAPRPVQLAGIGLPSKDLDTSRRALCQKPVLPPRLWWQVLWRATHR